MDNVPREVCVGDSQSGWEVRKPEFERLPTPFGLIRAGVAPDHQHTKSVAIVLVFPGGEYDSYRPTSEEDVIDFNGRTGYVTSAIDAGVPIVPTVSIGAQEGELFLSRGIGLSKRSGLDKRLRLKILPLTVGLPFGVSMILPPNMPLPTKIVNQVLAPIDIAATFGPDPDVKDVDAHVRSVTQAGLDALARERRFPVLG